MLFNSPEFLVFFLATTVAYFALPFRVRWVFLIIASYFFYMCWRWEYAFLILAQTLINYGCGLAISRSKTPAGRKGFLVLALVATLGMLAYFKYLSFLNESLRAALGIVHVPYNSPVLDILLPVGISFHMFQTLSYTIDVYQRRVPAEKHLGYFALFVVFYPQLVAGPIERATHLLPQLRQENHFSVSRLSSGLKIILWGLFKKVVIADRLALYVNAVYTDPSGHSGSTLLLATYCFAFQIYCDFSGYSDIAVGTARILGYDLIQNFRLPYLATSIADFWHRWHISLSTWFRDYVYFPLGGSRVGLARWAFNIMVAFLLSGLWHGANWTFVAWGGLHGFYYLAGRATAGARTKLKDLLGLRGWPAQALQVFCTFHLVLVGWVLFRAKSITDAALILRRIVTDLGGAIYWGPSTFQTAVTLGLLLLIPVIQWLQNRGLVSLHFSPPRLPAAVRWAGFVLAVFGIHCLGVSSNAFIYFQF